MDDYFLFRKLMDMLTEQGFAITGAKLTGYQIQVSGESGGDAVKITADIWHETKEAQ